MEWGGIPLYFTDMVLLMGSWLLVILSELTFPKVHTALSFHSDWSTFLFFKPFQLFVSFLCFLFACLLLRLITIKHCKRLFDQQKLPFKDLLAHLAIAFLGAWISIVVIMKHILPAMLMLASFLTIELLKGALAWRSKRRLKTALRKLQR
jgi:hypothetical protein